MKKEKKDPNTPNTGKSPLSRRNFVKGAATLAAAAATVPLKPLLGGPGSTVDASTIPYEADKPGATVRAFLKSMERLECLRERILD